MSESGNHLIAPGSAICRWAKVLLALPLLLSTLPAHGESEMTITVTNDARIGTLTNFPVLVALSTNIEHFSYEDFLSAEGHDLRFWADAERTIEIPCEVEKWDTNSLSGTSLMWVLVNEFSTNTQIHASWGNPAATNQQPYTTNGTVWGDGSFIGVWHMADTNGTDSTSNRFNGSSVGTITSTNGTIDGAVDLDADGDYYTVADSTAFNMNGGFSVSAWINSDALADYESILSTYNGDGWIFALQDGNSLSFWDGSWRATRTVADGQWWHVAFTHDGTAGKFFVNGTNCWTSSYSPGTRNGSTLALGGSPNWGSYVFNGKLDELRLEKTCRDTNWIWTTWMNAVSNSWLLNYGKVQSGAPDINTTNGAVADTTSAWLQATLVSTGAAAAEVWSFWGSADAGEDVSAWANTNYFGPVAGDPPLAYSNNVTSLSSNTLYYYAFLASNSIGPSWASSSFRTIGEPAVSNLPASGIGTNTASLGGSLYAGGTAHAVIYWGRTDAWTYPGLWEHAEDLGNVSFGTFSTNIIFSGAGPFYYRCYVTNAYGEDWCDVATRFTPVATNVLYVDYAATGANNGSSWENAFTNIPSAISAAVAGNQIWVARGVYKPGNARTNSFNMKANVGLYGGFSGGESSLDQRDVAKYQTVLSGDIDNNNTLDTGNSYHVVVGAANATFDGFTVTMGYADYTDGGGGGMYVGEFFQMIQNCTFVTNAAIRFGGAIFIQNGWAIGTSVIVSNCTFNGNYVWWQSGGGAIDVAVYMHCSWVKIYDSTFIENSCNGAYWGGGAVNLRDGFADIRRCVFARNYCSGNGGAVYTAMRDVLPAEAVLNLEDSTFYGNSAGGAGGGAFLSCANRAGDSIDGCDFYANSASGGGGLALGGFTRTLKNCRFLNNTAQSGNSGGGLWLSSSATIEKSLFAGNVADGSAGGMYFSAGTPTLVNCLVAGNKARYNGGGIYAVSGFYSAHNTLFGNETWGAGASYGGSGIYLAGGSAELTNTIVFGNSSVIAGRQIQVASGSAVLGLNSCDLDGSVAGIYNPSAGTITDRGGNVTNNPAFAESWTGTRRVTASNSTASGTTIITAPRSADWTAGSMVGKFVNPQAGVSSLLYLIVSNTVNTLTVLGNADAELSFYSIYDFGLAVTSPCVNTGTDCGITNDLASESRPQPVGGNPDIGAYEKPLDFDPPGAVTGLSTEPMHASIRFTWTNPVDADFAGVVVLRRTGSAPTGTPAASNTYSVGQAIGDGTVVYVGTGSNSAPGEASGWTNTNLANGNVYHYAFFAYDLTPNYAVGAVVAGTPLTDNLAPGPVASLTAAGGDRQIALAWTNPPDSDFQGVLVLKKTGGIPPSAVPVASNIYSAGFPLGDGTIAYFGPGNSPVPGGLSGWADTSVSNSATFSYSVFAFDEVPGYSPSSTATATSLTDPLPPGPVVGLLAVPDDRHVTLSWMNPSDSDFGGVVIIRKTGSAPTGAPSTGVGYTAGHAIGDGLVIYSGTGITPVPAAISGWTDTNVVNGTLYFYSVFARDEVQNYADPASKSATPRPVNVIYVDDSATGANTGMNWQDAFTNLQDALARTGATNTIWVAEGTYKPGSTRTNSFVMQTGVILYGGFTNGADSLFDRDWTNHPAILSGDIDGNGSLTGGNSYHVVAGADNARLDGFTVTFGYDDQPEGSGGGMYVGGNIYPIVANCMFTNNAATRFGGALCHILGGGSASSIMISNCVFSGNSVWSQSGGGAIHARTSGGCGALTILNSRFSDNSASGLQWGGGAICAYDVYTDIRGCVFERNACAGAGGAVWTYVRDVAPYGIGVVVKDTEFRLNSSSGSGGACTLSCAGRPQDDVSGCTFVANVANAGDGGALYLSGFNSTFEDCAFSGNRAMTGNGGSVFLSSSSVQAKHLKISGGNSPEGSGGGIFITGTATPRFENVLLAGNSARYLGGGLCLYDMNNNAVSLLNCTIAWNQSTDASYGGGGLYVRNASCSAENCIIYTNRVAGNGRQVFLGTASSPLTMSYSDLEDGLAGVYNPSVATITDAGNNISTNPAFFADWMGNWSAFATYDSQTGITALYDGTGTWEDNEIAGKFIEPNTADGNQRLFPVASNIQTTVWVYGNAQAGLPSAPYRILGFRLGEDSACLDTGSDNAPATDIEGKFRPMGAAMDMGAFEGPEFSAIPLGTTFWVR